MRLAYTSRPGVVGNGRNIIQWDCGRGHCRQQVSDVDDQGRRSSCDTGPVRLTLRLRCGRIHELHIIFWLGQSDNPRALALFEELLTRP